MSYGNRDARPRDNGYGSRVGSSRREDTRDGPHDKRDRPSDHRRSSSPGRSAHRSKQLDNGYPQRDGGGGGSSGRYDPRSDRGGSSSGVGRGGRGGDSYTSADRERERHGDRERYGDRNDGPPDEPPKSPPKPNYKPSGLLAQEANTVVVSAEKSAAAGKTGENKVVLKYHEPPEARKPTRNWRLYVFKGTQEMNMIPIHAQSSYLFGRDKLAVEIPIEHPSASKQHAVIQYRQMTEKNEFGDTKTAVKPFIIDLDSTNGTFVNDQEIPASRYYEIRASDVIKFAQSSREYVLLHEESA